MHSLRHSSPSYRSTYAHLEKDIISEYKKMQSLRKVKEKLGSQSPSHETIAKILKQHNIPLRKISSWEKISEKEQSQIAKKYTVGGDINELAETYSVCPQTIMRVLRKQNIEPLPRRKYTVDIRAFDNITPESVYWIGYLFGRGALKSDYHLEIVYTTEEQEERVKELKTFLKSSQPVKEVRLKKQNGTSYPQHRLVIGSKAIVDKLKEYGITTITKINYPSFAKNEMASHFIRGIFDSRGRFSNKEDQKMIFIGNHKFLIEVSNIIENETGIKGLINVDSETHARLSYSANNTKDVIKFLWADRSVKISSKLQKG